MQNLSKKTQLIQNEKHVSAEIFGKTDQLHMARRVGSSGGS